MVIASAMLLAACGSPITSPPPAPNTGLLRLLLELDLGIHAPLPENAPATTPVISPNPRIDAR